MPQQAIFSILLGPADSPADYPDRIAGVVTIKPGITVTPGHQHWAASAQRGSVSLEHADWVGDG